MSRIVSAEKRRAEESGVVGLKALKEVAKEVGLDLRGAYLNLDGGFDSTRNRQCIFRNSTKVTLCL